MPDESLQSLDREQQLDEAVTAFLEAQEAGRRAQREEWLARYPEVAAELAQFFADQDEVDRLTSPLRTALQATPPPDETPYPKLLDGASASISPGMLASPPEGYELLQVLGQGGMGVVYKARQKSADRLVALKLIRAERLMSEADVQRFRNEAEAAAQLDHPHIVPVYEVGARPGHFFFSMKLVEGGGLDGQLHRFRGDHAGAARLVAQVARAVHHAHQRGILHRDLKPSNILLDREGQPHVSDFGLAKRMEVDGSLTQTGAIVGTPQYMAPEQTSGRKGAVTTATDVYGLGAVLYELLTGWPPFQGETVLETLERVREREPERPRRFNSKVDRDLETICLKCLQKEPHRRYESAQALAEDLERWLAGEPIRARRTGQWEHLVKWVRRRPALASLVIVSVLALLSLLAGLLWHNAQLEEAAWREHQAAEREQQQAEEARIQRDQARQAVNDMYTDVAEKWLQQQPRLQPLQRHFLEKALRYYQRFAQEPSISPQERLATAEAYRRVADIRVKLGAHQQAIEAYRQGQAILEELADVFPHTAEYRVHLALLRMHLGTTLAATGAYVKAEAVFRQSVRLLEQLETENSITATQRGDLARVWINLGNVLSHGLGRFKEAEEAYSQALTHHQKLVDEFREQSAYQIGLQGTYHNLAVLYYETQRRAEAEKAFRQAWDIGEVLVARQPSNPEVRAKLALACLGLGTALAEWGQDKQVEEPLRRAEGLLNTLVKEFPDVPEYQGQLGSTYNALGNWLSDVGRNAEAEEAYRAALKVKEELVRASPHVPLYRQDVVQACNNLTLFLWEAHRLPEARKVNQRAREVAEQLVKDFPADATFRKDFARCHQRLAEVCQTAGDYEQSAEECRRAVEACPEDSDIQCGIAWLLATLPASFGDPARATELARKATRKDPESPYYWLTLGLSQYRAGDARGAVESLNKSLRLEKREPVYALLLLSMAHGRLGNRQQGQRYYDEAVGYITKSGSRDEQLLGFRAEAAKLLGIKEPGKKDKEASPEKK